MREDEFEALKADIQEHGVRERVIVKGKFVLDGIHRLRAARELGIEKDVKTRLFTGRDDKIDAMIISQNVHRRHLSDQQRAVLLALAIAPELKEQAKARQKAGVKPEEKEGEEKPEAGEAAVNLAEQAEVGHGIAREAIDIVTHLPKAEVRRVITTTGKKGKEVYAASAREARKIRLKTTGKPRKRKKPEVDKLAPEYVHKRFGVFLKHWKPDHHRKVRQIVREFLK
jgi:ParB-like chromosome segregation protein Spo0J